MNLVQMDINGLINAQRFVKMSLGILYDGGPGSGNFGHAGIPGQVGGSAPGEGFKKSVSDFKPSDSYIDSAEYKEAAKKIKECLQKSGELYEKRKELEEKLKKESKIKPRSEWNDDDEIESLLGNTPRTYTEEGEKLRSELVKLELQDLDIQEEKDIASETLHSLKDKAREKQLKEYKQKELVPVEEGKEYEGFTLEKTSNSFGDDYLKNGEGVVVEMSPKEYFDRCAYEIFSGTMESALGAVDEKTVEKYAEQMRGGTKFDLPYLNYKDSGQEGRHRAMAAYLNGVDRIPVLIIGDPPVLDRADAKEPDYYRNVNGNDIPFMNGVPIGGQMKAFGGAVFKMGPGARGGAGGGGGSTKKSSSKQGKLYGDRRGHIKPMKEGRIEDEDLEEYNRRALESIIEETGLSRDKAKKLQNAFNELHGGDGFSITHGHNKELSDIIDNGLSLMGTYDGEIYRGLSLEPDSEFSISEFLSKKPGDNLEPFSVTSWSSKPEVATEFAGINTPGASSVLLRCVNNKTGAGTQHISRHGTAEAEVNCPSTARWRIIDKKVQSKYDYLVDESARRRNPQDSLLLRYYAEHYKEKFEKDYLVSFIVEEV